MLSLGQHLLTITIIPLQPVKILPSPPGVPSKQGQGESSTSRLTVVVGKEEECSSNDAWAVSAASRHHCVVDTARDKNALWRGASRVPFPNWRRWPLQRRRGVQHCGF